MNNLCLITMSGSLRQQLRGQPLRPDSSDVERAWVFPSSCCDAMLVMQAVWSVQCHIHMYTSLPFNYVSCIMPALLWTVTWSQQHLSVYSILPSTWYTSCRWYFRETLAGSMLSIIIHLCVSNNDGVYSWIIHELKSLVKKQKFCNTKSTIMIEGQRDSETGEKD